MQHIVHFGYDRLFRVRSFEHSVVLFNKNTKIVNFIYTIDIIDYVTGIGNIHFGVGKSCS